MSSCGSNAGVATSAQMFNVVVNNALFHSNSHISQMPPQNHSHPVLLSGLVAPDFVITVLRSGLFNGQISGCSYGSLTLLYFRTGGNGCAQNVRVDTAHGKGNDQQNLSKLETKASPRRQCSTSRILSHECPLRGWS